MSLNINVNVPPRLIEQAREQQVERRLAMVQRQRQDAVRKEAVRKVQQERLARGQSADGKVPIGGTLEQRRRQWDGATALLLSGHKVGVLKHYGMQDTIYIKSGKFSSTTFSYEWTHKHQWKPVHSDTWIPLIEDIISGSFAGNISNQTRYYVRQSRFLLLPVHGETYIAIHSTMIVPTYIDESIRDFRHYGFLCTNDQHRPISLPSILTEAINRLYTRDPYFYAYISFYQNTRPSIDEGFTSKDLYNSRYAFADYNYCITYYRYNYETASQPLIAGYEPATYDGSNWNPRANSFKIGRAHV